MEENACTDPPDGPPENISVGSRVQRGNGVHGTIVRIELATHTPFIIMWDDRDYLIQHAVVSAFKHLCRNCDLPRAEHADGGKCLYGPTSWKA